MLKKLKEKYVFFDVDGTLSEYRFNDKLYSGGCPELGCQSLEDLLFSNLFAHYLRYCVHNFVVTSAAAGRTLCDFLNIFKSLFHVLEFCFAMKCVFNVCISHFFAITNCIVFHHKSPFILSKISLKYTLKAFYVSCLDTYLLILMLLKRRTYAVSGINSFLFAHKIFCPQMI